MSVMEIILLVVGAILFVASFFIPDKQEKLDRKTKEAIREEVKKGVNREMEEVKGHIDDVVEETVSYTMEKTERSLERLTNEKIMAVNEYSDIVLEEIHKNHEEAMFLYDMLNNKHANLKDTMSEVNKTVKEVEETTKEAETVVNQFQKLAGDTLPVEEVQKVIPAAEPVKTEEAPVQEIPEVLQTGGNNTLDISFMGEEDGRNSNEKILELYKQGKSNVAIARQLGLGVGEVKLVIDLYKNL